MVDVLVFCEDSAELAVFSVERVCRVDVHPALGVGALAQRRHDVRREPCVRRVVEGETPIRT